MDTGKIDDIILDLKDEYINELEELIKLKTVSAENELDVFDEASIYIKHLIINSGIEDVKIINDYGKPIIFAQKIINGSYKTVLFYAHYDVQPAEPLNLWNSDPFMLTIKNNIFYGRGVADDKTLLFSIIKALQLVNETKNGLKYNVKLIFDPSEESGSRELFNLFNDDKNKEYYKNLLKCDTLLACDSEMNSKEQPTISVSIRGILSIELTIFGPNKDIHSGSFGGLVGNPITEMCRLLGNVHNNDNAIVIEDFYKNVNSCTDNDTIDINEDEIKSDLEVLSFDKENGFTSKQVCSIRPTFELNGIYGGHTGSGSKTIIPSFCTAKISCRLVDNQDPDEILKKIDNHISKNIKKCFRYELKKVENGSIAIQSDTSSEEFKKVIYLMEDEFKKKIMFDKIGGSIPIVSEFKKNLFCEIVFVGFAYSNSNCHGPNENYSIESFEKGIKILFRYLTE